MMMGGYGFSWFAMTMMGVGTLLVIVLIAVSIWALVHWMNKQQAPVIVSAPQAQDSPQAYEQGYQPQQAQAQEAEVAYSYRQVQPPQDEQPQVEYPQEMLPPQ